MSEKDKPREDLRKIAQEKSKESIRRLSKEWPSKDTNFFHVKITAIEVDLPTKSSHESAKAARHFAKQARIHGFTDKGLDYLLRAESARKDFWLYDCAVKGELFTKKPPRGLDRLNKTLLKILGQLGKKASAKAVVKELGRIADPNSPVAIIKKVDNGVIFWRSKKRDEEQTPMGTIANRLTKLRKII